MTPHFDFSEVPYSFGLCAAENCPVEESLARQQNFPADDEP